MCVSVFTCLHKCYSKNVVIGIYWNGILEDSLQQQQQQSRHLKLTQTTAREVEHLSN